MRKYAIDSPKNWNAIFVSKFSGKIQLPSYYTIREGCSRSTHKSYSKNWYRFFMMTLLSQAYIGGYDQTDGRVWTYATGILTPLKKPDTLLNRIALSNPTTRKCACNSTSFVNGNSVHLKCNWIEKLERIWNGKVEAFPLHVHHEIVALFTRVQKEKQNLWDAGGAEVLPH